MTIPGIAVWQIRGRFGEFLVARRQHGDPHPGTLLDLDALAADLAHHCAAESLGVLDLRAMLRTVDLNGSELRRPEPPRVVRDRLIEAFLREDLVIVGSEPVRKPAGGDVKGTKGAPPPPPPAPPAPPPKVAEKTWIAIQLVNEEGKPCAKEKFKCTLPDGTTWEGKLDDKGQARKDGILPGTCKVTFPELGAATGKS